MLQFIEVIFRIGPVAVELGRRRTKKGGRGTKKGGRESFLDTGAALGYKSPCLVVLALQPEIWPIMC